MIASTTPSATTGSFTATSAMNLVIAAAEKSLFAMSKPRNRSWYSSRGAFLSRRGTEIVAQIRSTSDCARRSAPKEGRAEQGSALAVLMCLCEGHNFVHEDSDPVEEGVEEEAKIED